MIVLKVCFALTKGITFECIFENEGWDSPVGTLYTWRVDPGEVNLSNNANEKFIDLDKRVKEILAQPWILKWYCWW